MKKSNRIISILLAMSLLLIGLSACEGSKDKTWDIVKDAYIFTFPLVIMKATQQNVTNVPPGVVFGRAPINQFIHYRNLANASVRVVVTPNVDTIYSMAYLDLSSDALVLRKPAADRYFSIQVLDAYTNCVSILGTGGSPGEDTQDARNYLVAGPNFNGVTPTGMTRLDIPTNMAWFIVRIIVNNTADLVNVYPIQNGMAIVPLQAYNENGFEYTLPKGEYDPNNNFVPINHVFAMPPKEYFDLANELMVQNPPAAADAPMMKHLAKIKVGPGLTFDPSVLGNDAELKWQEMRDNLMENLLNKTAAFQKSMGAWQLYTTPIAEFGTEYAFRTFIAIDALGANPVWMSMYLKADNDDEGNLLNGANKYRVRFKKDALPPVEAEYGFWSVTAYDKENFLIANELNRYVINDRSNAALNADGSLEILLQTEAPADNSKFNNWLPVKSEGFHLYMRIYIPLESALDGTWQFPSIIQE